MRALTFAVAALALFCIAARAEPAGAALPGHSIVAPVTDFSAAKRRKSPPRVAAQPRYRHGPGTIACTRGGCQPVPAGCHAIRERTIDDSPSGFQIIVC